MKLRAMVQVEVSLTDQEWRDICTDYARNWAREIVEGDVCAFPNEPDAWSGMLITQHGNPGNYVIVWETSEQEEFVDEEPDPHGAPGADPHTEPS